MTLNGLRAALCRTLSVALLGLPAVAQAELPLTTPGKLTIGSDLTYPPYDWVDKHHQPQGIDPELMTLIARELNLEADFHDTRFVSLLPGVRRQRFDVAASVITITPERLQTVDFIPYLKSGEALLVRHDMATPPTKADALCGHSVAVLESAAWIPQLEALSGQCVQQGQNAIQIRTFDTNPHATHALTSRNVDVQLIDSVMAERVVEQLKGAVVISSDRLLYTEVLGIAVSKERPALKSAIERALNQLRTSGEYQRLLQRYGVEAAQTGDLPEAR
ncbi:MULTISPECIES: ABC transporter substrate-binding protein [unclassified Zymobacter]|uniref:ABC transporter substrate-binding protein n=1 Tax=unclassified Zymobacter TaxID=3048685 RepID=UPI0039C40A98